MRETIEEAKKRDEGKPVQKESKKSRRIKRRKERERKRKEAEAAANNEL